MEKHSKALLAAILFALSANAMCAEQSLQAQALISTPTGKYYRPGAWTPARIILNVSIASDSELTPELVIKSAEGTELFASRLPRSIYASGRHELLFWLIPGKDAAAIEFRLLGNGGETFFSRTWRDVYIPTPHGTRIILTTSRRRPVMDNNIFSPVNQSDLPTEGFLYENADLLILEAAPPLRKEQYAGICEWITLGGKVIVMDRHSTTGILKAASIIGVEPSPPFPFIIRKEKEGGYDIFAPHANRIGLGVVIDLSSVPEGRSMIMSGKEVWTELDKKYLTRAVNEGRLSRARYSRLGNRPDKPRISGSTLARWIVVWALLSLSCLAVPAVRKNQWLSALCISAISIAVAWRFGESNPVPVANTVHAKIRIVGEAGKDGPTMDEDIWFVRKYSLDSPATIAFKKLPPPRLQNTPGDKTGEQRLELAPGAIGGSLRSMPLRKNSASERPLIFSRKSFGKSITGPDLLCSIGPDGKIMLSASSQAAAVPAGSILKTPFGTAVVKSRKGEEYELEKYAVDSDLTDPRRLVLHIIEPEHKPGVYSTLAIWRGEASGGELGELEIHTINTLPPAQ